MSGRGGSLLAMERQIRRVAQRRGLSMLIAQKRNAKIDAHGGYMLRDDMTFAIVFGNKGYEFSADLEEIEAWLEANEEEEEPEG
jgi:hypothetical protein